MSRRRSLHALLALVTLTALLLASCDTGPTPTPTQPVSATPAASTSPASSPVAAGRTPGAVSSPPAVTPGPARPTPTPAPPTSIDKILAAEEAGKLDHDTSLLYQLYAAFVSPALPAEYRGEDAGLHVETTLLLLELAERRDQLAPALREKVLPFFLRPADPGSFWQQSAAQRSPARGHLKLAAPLRAFTFDYVDTPITKTRIWYVVENGEEARQQAAELAVEVERSRMWGMEQQAMLDREPCTDEKTPAPQNGGDGRLDIYVIPMAGRIDWQGRTHDFGHAGLAVPESYTDCGWSTYLLVAADQDFPHLKSTTAHELFHAFQFAFKVKQRPQDYYWWVEASANWAEDLVYPELNFEHDVLAPGEWATHWANVKRAGPLDRYKAGTSYQYAAYIWPFYLTRRPGGRPEDVGSIWLNTQYKRPIDVMHDLGDWEDSFKQFALWNLNGGLADKYRDVGKRIEPLKQHVQCWTGECRVTLGQHTPLLDLPHASMQYYSLSPLEDQPFRQLRFDLAGITGKEGAGLQALVTYRNFANPQGDQVLLDWSDLPERRFCLDVEDVTKITLVVTNSNVHKNQRLAGSMVLHALEEPCVTNANMQYNATVAYTVDVAEGGRVAHAEASGQELVSSEWQVGFDYRMNDDLYYVVTATNHIQVMGSAFGRETNGGTVSSANLSIGGAGVSHNPVQPGDVQYERDTMVMGGGFMYRSAPNSPGQLHLYEQDGKHYYEMSLAIAQIYADYRTYERSDWECPRWGPASHVETFDNRTGIWTSDYTLPKECENRYDSTTHYDKPYTFGSIVPYRQGPRPNGVPGGWISGEYDPRTGILEGEEQMTVTNCEHVPLHDPLDLGSLLPFTGPAEGTASCLLHYTLTWHLELP